MGYDVAFWMETTKCKYDTATIYRRLRRGLAVDGLKPIPRAKAQKIIRSLLKECQDEGGGFFKGQLDDAHIDVRLADNAILADFPIAAWHLAETLTKAFAPLSLYAYDPQCAPPSEGENLYDADYEEVSGDPNTGYWVPVTLTNPPPHNIDGTSSIGGQTVGEIAYSFFPVSSPPQEAPAGGIFELYGRIQAGRASVPIERFNCGNLDDCGTLAVMIVVPAELIERYAIGQDPRKHVRMFTAFGTDDKVVHYHHWHPHSPGVCATVITLSEMPTRMKTLISTQFVHFG
jgi:hypothetical protein